MAPGRRWINLASEPCQLPRTPTLLMRAKGTLISRLPQHHLSGDRAMGNLSLDYFSRKSAASRQQPACSEITMNGLACAQAPSLCLGDDDKRRRRVCAGCASTRLPVRLTRDNAVVIAACWL